jgi:hypothetical protein
MQRSDDAAAVSMASANISKPTDALVSNDVMPPRTSYHCSAVAICEFRAGIENFASL